MKLFSLLSEASQVTNEDMQDAYLHFMEYIKIISQSEQSYSEIFRILSITRIELDFLGTSLFASLEKKFKEIYQRKAILFLDSEIDLLKFTFRQTNHLVSNNVPNNSKVYFTPKSQGLGIGSMGEFAVLFELSGQFLDGEGNPAPYIHIAHAIEQAFNFTFGDAYESKERISNVSPTTLSKLLIV